MNGENNMKQDKRKNCDKNKSLFKNEMNKEYLHENKHKLKMREDKDNKMLHEMHSLWLNKRLKEISKEHMKLKEEI